MNNDQPTHASPCLRLNDKAPDFTARSTHGVINLSDYSGQWLLLFSHPADFTPVCTSEFIAFEKAADKFQALNCSLLGLSADSIYSHLAWIMNIKERFDVDISFPVIEDLSLVIAEQYGMIDETSVSTATVRSIFFINPEAIIKTIIHYPMTVGRSVDEILRVLNALVATEKGEVAAPEGWQAGDPMLLSPPTTIEDIKARMTNTQNPVDWYYNKTSGTGD